MVGDAFGQFELRFVYRFMYQQPVRQPDPFDLSFTSSEYSFAQDILITWYLIDELPQFKTRIVIITSVNDEI